MELECYKIHDTAPEMVPGIRRRDWMDAFPDRHPYRCLPLTMANTTGWEILCPMDIKIVWDGGEYENAIKLYTTGNPNAVASFAQSHFRRGIVTFHTGYLFRTPPGWGVWSTGSPNWFKHGIAPLTGLIETDWLPFPFTMNWQMTKPGEVVFKKGEPFCFITLMEHNKLEDVQPVIRKLDQNAELKADYLSWNKSRSNFNKKLRDRDPEVEKQGWQRHYMKGETHSGDSFDAHVTKRLLKVPKEE